MVSYDRELEHLRKIANALPMDARIIRAVATSTAIETGQSVAELERALTDLQIPPGNRLEPLRGDRHGQHSIRINDKFRLCFVWTDAGPEEVEIMDCH